MAKKSNKKVLITNGSGAIGEEAVKAFASRGAQVAFFYNDMQKEAFALSNRTGALAVRCDVSNPASVKSAMETCKQFYHGELDVLVCNAGLSDYNLVTQIGSERWNEVINVNLNSVYYTINEILPQMIEAKQGNIIIVSSMWGQVGASSEVAFSTAKAGLIGMTKALAKELGPSGIRVNCIAPGNIKDDTAIDADEELTRAYIKGTPLMRLGDASEVAALMEFLASDRLGFITGQIIGVNGGSVV